MKKIITITIRKIREYNSQLITGFLLLSIAVAMTNTAYSLRYRNNKDNNIPVPEVSDNIIKDIDFDTQKLIFDSSKIKFDNLLNTEIEDILTILEEEKEKQPKIYTTKANDTYYEICQEFYGDGEYCLALGKYNQRSDYPNIEIGMELKIPNLDDPEFIQMCEVAKQEKIEQQKQEEERKRKLEEEKKQRSIQLASRGNSSGTATPIVKTSNNVKNNPGEVDTSGYTLYKTMRITGYVGDCYECNGNTHGITASGTKATSGRTVAAPKDLPFGTTLYIKGYGYYTVEDRGGFGNNIIDMVCPSHEVANSITKSGVEVYIVP